MLDIFSLERFGRFERTGRGSGGGNEPYDPNWTPELLSPMFWADGFNPDNNRMWTANDGITPVTDANMTVGKLASAVGDIVGLQATALSRPTLVKWPKGGRRNRITYSEDFSAAGWGKTRMTVSGTLESVHGVLYNIIPSTASSTHAVLQNIAVSIGDTASISFVAKSAGMDAIHIFSGVGNSGFTGSAWAYFNLSNGTVGSLGPAISGATMIPLGDGLYECRVKFTTGSASTSAQIQFTPAPTSSGGRGPSFAGNGTDGVYLGRVQIDINSDFTPYQKVVSANEITEEGIPSIWHLFNDGGDSLTTTFAEGRVYCAYIDHLGQLSKSEYYSDGEYPSNLMTGIRMADIVVLNRKFTSKDLKNLNNFWTKFKP